MAPRKGLSFEEKRERLLQLFTETADFFTLKELEKVASKRKGIVSQSVKEVLQSLVDDNLVNTDKCGVQTVFWALPSEASQKKKEKLAQLEDDVSKAEKGEQQLDEEIEKLEVGREETDERNETLGRIEELTKSICVIDNELERFAEFDPEEMEKVKENTKAAKEAANRWIDNIFNLQSWANKTFMMEKKDFSTQFGIPEDLDYME